MNLKLEVGRYYRTRDGRKFGPAEWKDGFFSINGWHYNLHGIHGYRGQTELSFRKLDLIAEWQDEPKQHGIGYTMTKDEIGLTGTLAELGAQVGDVVEWVSDDGVSSLAMAHVGKTHTIQNDGRVMLDGGDGSYWGKLGENDGYAVVKWRIVSRAKPKGPVITETVTRKRIVAGVYGAIKIHDPGSKYVRVNVDAPMSRADLTAAIETLTQIRDAMPHQNHA